MAQPIGGNIADIVKVSETLNKAAEESRLTTGKTADHAGQLHTDVNEAMKKLMTSFGQTATELRTLITTSHGAFNDSNWTGKSKDAANIVRNELSEGVDGIIDQVNLDFEAEQTAFLGRIDDLTAQINDSFKAVMDDVDLRYTNLSKAAADTATNFELADDTIKIQG